MLETEKFAIKAWSRTCFLRARVQAMFRALTSRLDLEQGISSALHTHCLTGSASKSVQALLFVVTPGWLRTVRNKRHTNCATELLKCSPVIACFELGVASQMLRPSRPKHK